MAKTMMNKIIGHWPGIVLTAVGIIAIWIGQGMYDDGARINGRALQFFGTAFFIGYWIWLVFEVSGKKKN